jgi:hypothetical protein
VWKLKEQARVLFRLMYGFEGGHVHASSGTAQQVMMTFVVVYPKRD